MEDPVKEIPAIIRGLTTLSPAHQSHIIEKYYLPTASFHHPMCYVPSFCLWKQGSEGSSGKPQIDSRMFIKGIYRWYKILSPTIEMTVQSVACDANPRYRSKGLSTLYVDCIQAMYFWFLPRWYRRAEVRLIVVLSIERHQVDDDGTDAIIEENAEQESSLAELHKATFVEDVGYVGEKLAGSEKDEVEGRHRKVKWFIAKQRDLYPPEELAQFALFMPGTTLFVYCFQIVATLLCVAAAQIAKMSGLFPDKDENVCAECQDMNTCTDRHQEPTK